MKDSLNTAKFVLMATSPEFRERFFGDLDRLSEEFMIDEDSKKEIARLDLEKLKALLGPKAEIKLTPGGLIAKHTENSHTSHNKDAHDKSSHKDDRSMVGKLNWSQLITEYGELADEKEFAKAVIERHGGPGPATP